MCHFNVPCAELAAVLFLSGARQQYTGPQIGLVARITTLLHCAASTVSGCACMQQLGDKTAARKLAIEAGVAVVPGTQEPVPDVEAAQEFAREAGYPVMLKAAMGGGGRGMRVVRRCVCTVLLTCLFVSVMFYAGVLFTAGELRGGGGGGVDWGMQEHLCSQVI